MDPALTEALQRIESKVDALESKVDALAGQTQRINSRIEIESKSLGRSVASLVEQLRHLGALVEIIAKEQGRIATTYSELSNRFSEMMGVTIRARSGEHDVAIDPLTQGRLPSPPECALERPSPGNGGPDSAELG